jgi:uncharacterized membrane protein
MANLNDVLNSSDSLKTPSMSGGIGGSSNKELMARARTALSGNWGMAILGYILYTVLKASFSGFVVAAVFFVTFVSSTAGADPEVAVSGMGAFANLVELLVAGAFAVGFMGFFLGIAQDSEARLELLFVGFQRFFKSFGVYFFYSLFILLWTLLFIIPGIIAIFRYAMAFYIIADDEACGPLEAIGRSKEMMRGNKWKFFCLHWRFLGWGLLAVFFTFGIGFIWLVPYLQTSFAKFYEDVK